MKKIILTAFVGLVAQFSFAQADFTVNDCAGNSHHLYSELDGGKVVVITWVMPCGACIAIASTAATTVQGYSSTYPGRVKFYLSDDYADTPCNTLTSWASTNSITTNAVFSDAAVSMADYGGPGMSMQKTVILGGANHTVFYNVNGTVSANAMKTAITNALAATTGIPNNNISMGLSVFPNPALYDTKITYTLTKATNVSIELMNILGEKVNTTSLGVQSPGKQEYQINVETLKEGVYFIKLNAGEAVETIKITVVH
jgi:hypothetical protein